MPWQHSWENTSRNILEEAIQGDGHVLPLEHLLWPYRQGPLLLSGGAMQGRRCKTAFITRVNLR